MSFFLRSKSRVNADENWDTSLKRETTSIKPEMPENREKTNCFINKKRRHFFTSNNLKEGDKIYAKSEDRTFKEATIIGKFNNSYFVRFKSGKKKVIEGTRLKHANQIAIKGKKNINKSLNSVQSQKLNKMESNQNQDLVSTSSISYNTRSSHKKNHNLDKLVKPGKPGETNALSSKTNTKSQNFTIETSSPFSTKHIEKATLCEEDDSSIKSPILTRSQNIQSSSFSTFTPKNNESDSRRMKKSSSLSKSKNIFLSPIIENSFSCSIDNCTRSFRTKSILDSHVRIFHSPKICSTNITLPKRKNAKDPKAKLGNGHFNLKDPVIVNCYCGQDFVNLEIIQCISCKSWVHKLCSNLTDDIESFVCYNCGLSSTEVGSELVNFFLENGLFISPDVNRMCEITPHHANVIRQIYKMTTSAFDILSQYKSENYNREKINIKLEAVSSEYEKLRTMALQYFPPLTKEEIILSRDLFKNL